MVIYYLIHTWSDKAFESTDVNWLLPSVQGGSPEITLTVPLNLKKKFLIFFCYRRFWWQPSRRLWTWNETRTEWSTCPTQENPLGSARWDGAVQGSKRGWMGWTGKKWLLLITGRCGSRRIQIKSILSFKSNPCCYTLSYK